MTTIHEDDNFVVVDKPPNTLSVPSRMGKDDNRLCVGIELQDQLGTQIFPVHRLDFEVRGILLFAKNEKSHKSASLEFQNRRTIKEYLAITSSQGVSSEILGRKQTWESKLVRGKKRSFEADYGKEAITETHLERIEDEQAFWKIRPLTGRPHQIRYEFAKRELPVLGDELYGASGPFVGEGIALQAYRLKILGQEYTVPTPLYSPAPAIE